MIWVGFGVVLSSLVFQFACACAADHRLRKGL